VALVPLTWSRDASWRDERSLYEAMLADRPDDPESRFAAGMMAFAEGDIERAYIHCRAYAEARTDSEKANLCIGSWLLVHRRPDEAAAHLRPYALSRPAMPTARRAFLASLFASRQFDEARQTVEAWSTTYAGASEIEEAKAALGTLADEPAPPHGDPAPPTDERALPKDERALPKDEPAPSKDEAVERP
jgi:predicted Zn-dependent protease